LQIQPGVDVLFYPKCSLIVSNGLLAAQGSGISNITFGAYFAPAADPTNRWGAVAFLEGAMDAQFDQTGVCTGGCVVEYATIRYAGGTNFDGAVYITNASPCIRQCVVAENIRSGVAVLGGYGPRLEGNSISNNAAVRGGGVRMEHLLARPDSLAISNELVGIGDGYDRTFEGQFSGHPVLPGSLVITDGTEVLSDPDGDGNITGGIGASGSIQYTTGVFTASFTLQPGAGVNVLAHYRKDMVDPLDFLSITNNVIRGNSADMGGGVYMTFAPGMNLVANQIGWNVAANSGGGVCLENQSKSFIVGNNIQSNRAARGGGLCFVGDGSGGAAVEDELVGVGNGVDKTFSGQLSMYPVEPGSLTITDGTEQFSDPDADGILTGSDGGSGVLVHDTGSFAVSFRLQPSAGCKVTANYISGGYVTGGRLVVAGNTVLTNWALAGG
jgi:hypothetical protein